MHTVLVVDDDVAVRTWLERELRSSGHEPLVAGGGREAIEIARRRPPALALIDQRMPDLDGIATLAALLAVLPNLRAYLFTGFVLSEPEIDRALRAGFVGYLQKPLEPEVLRTRVEAALPAERHAAGLLEIERWIGESPAIREVLTTIARVAPLDVPVLIRGESGTGKELVARAVHAQSPRRTGPFEAVNCSGVPATLFEAEFFGHEKGAFTGADQRRSGVFERANGGTVFLDEVGELPTELQTKLLRVLEDGWVPRLGGRPVRVDVRIIAATNRDLELAMRTGAFRQDLYWRLAAVPVTLPPVRDRGMDIGLLIDHYLERARAELRRPNVTLSADARALLIQHAWPGNVREIEHRLRQTVLGATGVVRVRDVPGELRRPDLGLKPVDFEWPANLSMTEAGRQVLRTLEPKWIRAALRSSGGSLSATARTLAIAPRTLHRKMQRYRIARQQD